MKKKTIATKTVQKRDRDITAFDSTRDFKLKLKKSAKKSGLSMSGFIRKVLSKELGVLA